HTLVRVVEQPLPPGISLPTCCTVAPLQLSLAVGGVKVGVAVHSTVMFGTVPITGGVLSMIEIVWETVLLELPQASTAFHTLVRVVEQPLPPGISLPTCCTVAPLQLSLAVGGVKVGVAVHSTVKFGTVPITGGVLSMIEIVCDTVLLELPQASTAFHTLVRVVAQPLPPGISVPTCCTVAPLQLSLAVGGVKVGVAVHSTVMFGTVPITGGVLSMIEIVWETVLLELPQASTAFHTLVRVVEQPLPPGISLPTCCTVAPLHASVVVGGVKVGVAVHSTVRFGTVPITGGVLSMIEIVWDTVLLELPQASTAFPTLVRVVEKPLPSGR